MLKKVLAMLLVMTMLVSSSVLSGGIIVGADTDDVLFEDHFDTATDNVWSASSGKWAVQNGVYSQTDISGGAMAFAGDVDWVNYEVEVTVTPHAASAQGIYAMVCGRADGPQNRYVGSYSGNKLLIDRRINGQSTILAEKAYTMQLGQSYTLTLVFAGSHIAFYVNGTLELETDDTTHSGGKIGLATYKTQADFDDVIVRHVTQMVTPPDPADDVLFQDDFDTEKAGVWSVSGGKWAVQNGVYSQTDLNAGAMSFAGDTSWTNYEISADITPIKSNGSMYIMLSGRADGTKNRYVGTYNGNELLIDRRIDGQSAILVKKSCKLELGKTYTMVMRFANSSIRVAIEGVAEVETEDDTHMSGKIGLATYKTQANFDNVLVKKLSESEVPDMPLRVQAPRNYQVIQRHVETKNAPLTINGQVYLEEAASVQARVLAYDDSDTVIVDWTDVPLQGKAYTGTVTVPQGGWYRLEVRALAADKTVLHVVTDTHKWGVGINILCIGQSNMVGQGTPPYTVAHDLVSNFRSNAWSHLVDPYDGAGASLVPAMANALVEQLQVPIGIIPAADSGSGLHEPNVGNAAHWYWMYYDKNNPQNASTLYGRAVSRALAAGGVELAVWNQGETDGRMLVPKDTYKADMKELLARFRRDLNNEALSIFLCQIGTHDTNISNDDAYSAIRSAQQELDDGENFFMAATEMEFARKDTAHYTTPGMNEIGRRVANGILYYYGLSAYYRGPYIATAQFADATRKIVDVSIVHRGGDDIVTTGEITGFSALDGDTPIQVQSARRQDDHTIRLTLAKAATGDTRIRYLYGLNPEHTHVAKDNTPLQLPLEVTSADIVVSDHQHVWGEWTETRPATTTQEGERAHTCTACGVTETEPIPKLVEHTHVWGEWVVVKPATAEENGIEERTCPECGQKETRPLVYQPIVVYGDVNGDGEVTASDALMALQAATGKITLTAKKEIAADVDGKAGVTASDALMILQYATQKIMTFPVETGALSA